MSVPVHTRRASFTIMHPRLLTHDDGDEEALMRALFSRARVSSLSSPFFPPTSPAFLSSLAAL